MRSDAISVVSSGAARRNAFWRHVLAHPLKTVFVLALLVRLINVALLRGNDSFFAGTDARGYWDLGASLTKPAMFWTNLSAITDRMPLFPLLVAGVQSTLGDAPRAVALLHSVIDAGTCTLIAALGALISPLVGLIAGILAALSVTLIVNSSQVLTDPLFLFFFTSMLLTGARFLRRPTIGLAVLAGLLGGLSLATRHAVGVLMVAAVPLVFFIAAVRRRDLRTALAAALVFAIAAAVPVAPVLIRNAAQYGAFSLTSQTGDHLAFWIVPMVTQRADGTQYQATVDRIEARYRQIVAERGPSSAADPFRRSAVLAELAREELERLPLAAYVKAWLEGMVVNLAAPALLSDPRVRALPRPSFYSTPGASLWERARHYVFDDPGLYQFLLVIGVIGMLPFLALEAIGLVMLARALPWAAVFAGGVLAYFLLLSGPVAAPKYRLPMEPVLIVLAALPLARLVQRGSRNPAPAPGDGR
jgi:hypothetical protein